MRAEPIEEDREPQPSDGPDYHADHRAWEERQRRRRHEKLNKKVGGQWLN